MIKVIKKILLVILINLLFIINVKGKTYTITFDANGGDGGNVPSAVSATYDSAMPNISSSDKPTRSGYAFKGWYYYDNSSDKSLYVKGKQYYTSANASARNFDMQKDITLYAGWVRRKGTYDDAKQIIKEVMAAYYMRNTSIQYNFAKAGYGEYSPEEATSQDNKYLVCAAFGYSVYQEAFTMSKLPMYVLTTLADAKRYYCNLKDKTTTDNKYLLYYYKNNPTADFCDNISEEEVLDDTDDDDGSNNITESSDETNVAIVNPIVFPRNKDDESSLKPAYKVSDLQPGDILATNKHVLVVYDVGINPRTGKTDALLLNATTNTYIPSRIFSTSGLQYNAFPHSAIVDGAKKNVQPTGLLDLSTSTSKGVEGGIRLAWLGDKTKGNMLYSDGETIKCQISKKIDECAIIRPFYKNGSNAYFNYNIAESRYNKSLLRLQFPGLYIEKTVVNETTGNTMADNDSVNIGDILKYKIRVINNSPVMNNNNNYGKFTITENIDYKKVDFINTGESGNPIVNNGVTTGVTWTISSLNAGNSITRVYRVQVKNNNNIVNSTITAQGKLTSSDSTSYISTGTIENKIVSSKTNNITYNDCYNRYPTLTGLELINEVVKCKTGQNYHFDSFKFFDPDKTDNVNYNGNIIGYSNTIETSKNTSDDYIYLMNLENGNLYNNYKSMILNNYWNRLAVINNDGNHKVALPRWRCSDPNHNCSANNRAKTINPGDFKEGDILIYYVDYDSLKYGKHSSYSTTPSDNRNTNEKGIYTYIYINGKFVGVNLGNDGVSGTNDDRNEFTSDYYNSTESRKKLYACTGNAKCYPLDTYNKYYNNTPIYNDGEKVSILEYLNYQTLFDKDYYVILRPGQNATTTTLNAKTTTYTGSAIAANTATSTLGDEGIAISGAEYTYYYYTDSNCSVGETTSAPKNAGTYYVQAELMATNDYSSSRSGCVKHTISKKELSVTWQGENINYDGTPHSSIPSVETGVTGETMKFSRVYKEVVGSNETTLSSAPIDVGNYKVTVSCASITGGQAKCDNYKLSATTVTKEYSIVRVTPTLSLSSTSGTLTYGTPVTITITTNSTGALSCSSNATSTATCSVSGKTLTVTPAAVTTDGGKATITVSLAETTNYNAASVKYTATVNRKSLTCPSSPANKTYTGSSQSSGIKCPTGSSTSGDTSKTDAGTYIQTCTATAGYKFESACNIRWYINSAKTATTGSCNTLTYTGGAQTLASGATNATYSNNSGTNAGSYTVTVNSKPNYEFEDGSTSKILNCVINKIPLTVKAYDKSKEYDGTALVYTNGCGITEGQRLSNHELSCTCTGSQTDAGSSAKTITVVKLMDGSIDVTGNYEITKVNGTLTVTKKEIPVIWNDVTEFTYNGSDQAPSASVDTGISNETMKISINDFKDVGSHTSTATCSSVKGGQANCNNYTLTNATKSYIIKAKEITITAKDQTIEYGSDISKTVNDAMVDSLVTKDRLEKITLQQEILSNGTPVIMPSSAKITNGPKDTTGNYIITYIPGTLTITGTPQPIFTLPEIVIDATNNLIKNVSLKITIKNFFDTTINNTGVQIYSSSGDLLYDKDTVDNSLIMATGQYVMYQNESGTFVTIKISVPGDVNGDGKISSLDYVKIKNHIMETTDITGVEYIEAADYNNDSKISSLDYVKVKKYIMNN